MAFRRTALGSSAGPTMSCNSIWLDVCHSTPAQPCSTSSSMAPPMLRLSVTKKYPQPSDAVMNSAMPAWMMRRASNRSFSAPTPTEKARKGNQ